MKLIDDWKTAHRFWSVRLGVLGAALMAVITIWPDGVIWLWNMMPAQIEILLPERMVSIIGGLLYALAILARIVRQPTLHGKSDGEENR